MTSRSVHIAGAVAYVPLTQGKEALISSADADFIGQWIWCYNSRGYAYRKARKGSRQVTLYLHRVLLDAPDGTVVDHINGDGLDNRRLNLRFCTHAQNMVNRKLNINNSSGFKGVVWHKPRRKFIAQIQCGGKRIHLGYYLTAELAHKAYLAASAELHGQFARN